MTDGLDPDDMLAAEYAIGLLTGAEADEARRRMDSDPAFAARVVDWEARLSQMVDLPEVSPPRAAKAALLHDLFPDTAPKPLWSRLMGWRGALGAAVAVMALVAVVVWQNPTAVRTGPTYTAEIASEAGDFRVVAVVDTQVEQVTLTRLAGAPPDGRILQVWAHGPDKPAQSVGLWPQGETVSLALPPEIAAVSDTLTLGVSEEPIGGSPTGSPTGRVYGTVDIALGGRN